MAKARPGLTDWTPSEDLKRVADANRAYYSEVADLYETTEVCVTDPRAQRMLEEDLNAILAIHHKPAEHLRGLDACAGSGNVALKLLARGVDLTACDISPHLLAMLKQKTLSLGYSPTIVCSEVAQFLSREKTPFDLIVFSSALHHLPDIGTVLRLAIARLTEGGLIYTVFDPTLRSQLSRAARWLTKADYYAFKVLRQTRDVPSATMRRMRRMRASLRRRETGVFRKQDLPLSNENLGVIAEYHVETGIDDRALVQQLKTQGMEIVWHIRYADARFGLARKLLSSMGDVTSFKLLVRKPVRTRTRTSRP